MRLCIRPSTSTTQRFKTEIIFCSKQAVRPPLPEKVTRARLLKRAGLAGSGLLVAGGVLLAGAKGVSLPEVPGWLPWSVAAAVGAPLAVLAAAKAVLGDSLQMEVHDGRIYIELVSPTAGACVLAEGAVQVLPSEGKGNGAFAAQPIPAGTYLGDYEGELLHETDYWDRYPNGVADYCIGIDREWTIDGRERAKDTSRFSPCHMNHSSTRPNVVRKCSRREGRVSFYTTRTIQAGEEILLDYGRLYWKGREDQVLP